MDDAIRGGDEDLATKLMRRLANIDDGPDDEPEATDDGPESGGAPE